MHTNIRSSSWKLFRSSSPIRDFGAAFYERSTKGRPVAGQASRWLLAILVTMALLVGGNSARAQQITGAITGTVTDPQGAMVANASI